MFDLEEYWQHVNEYRRELGSGIRHMREGQLLSNVFLEHYEAYSQDLLERGSDPFYNDARILGFVEFLQQLHQQTLDRKAEVARLATVTG